MAEDAKRGGSTRIAIVGASVRAAAASAARAGFEVRAADLFADQDLRAIAAATPIRNYPAGLHDWLARLDPPPDGWMYTGALENHPRLVDAMADIAPLWGNPGAVLRQVRSPWQLAETLRRAEVLFPEIRTSADGLPRDGSWLAKTGRGASGSGVWSWDESRPTADLHAAAGGLFFQRRVSGTPCSAVFVAANGAASLCGVVKQLVGEPWLFAGEFQYCGAVGPWPVPDETLVEIQRIGSTLARRFRLRGGFGVDFVLESGRPWTVEVNPRWPASAEILERSTGLSVLAAHTEACLLAKLPSQEGGIPGVLHGKAVVFSRQPVRISDAFSKFLSNPPHAGPWPPLGDVPAGRTRIGIHQPVLTVFASGATPTEVVANLQDRVAEIESRLYV